MRLSSPGVVVVTGLILAVVSPAGAQTTPDAPTGSLLAPRSMGVPPAPTPIQPDATAPATEPPAQSIGPSSVTEEPLPPPGAPSSAPSAAPVPVAPPAPTVAGPAPVAPVAPPPAAPPPSASPPAAVANSPATTQPTAPTPLTPIPLTLPPRPPTAAAVERVPTPAPRSPGLSEVVAPLPTPPLAPEASPVDFLRAARGAVAAGRTGEARASLEMAQTRLLSRVVDAGKEDLPSNNPAVRQISDALSALRANDRMTCLHYIELASQTLGSPLD